jgi:phosphohistidine phosphatase SixA
MRIYLAQHGLAVPKDVDPDRPLSDQGHQHVELLSDFLKQAGIRVEQVFHSGKTRAEQTASILARSILSAGGSQARGGLGPKACEPLPHAEVKRAGKAWMIQSSSVSSSVAHMISSPSVRTFTRP